MSNVWSERSSKCDWSPTQARVQNIWQEAMVWPCRIWRLSWSYSSLSGHCLSHAACLCGARGRRWAQAGCRSPAAGSTPLSINWELGGLGHPPGTEAPSGSVWGSRDAVRQVASSCHTGHIGPRHPNSSLASISCPDTWVWTRRRWHRQRERERGMISLFFFKKKRKGWLCGEMFSGRRYSLSFISVYSPVYGEEEAVIPVFWEKKIVIEGWRLLLALLH